MSRKRFTEMNCGIAQALEQVGDWWTLLIIRDAFLGTTRFADFEQQLGIAKNILSDRLSRLVGHGILTREPAGDGARRHAYRLTEKGRDLWPVLTALRLWSDKWVFGPGREPLLVRDRETGAVVSGLRAVDAQGRALDPRRLAAVAGPGASDDDRSRLAPERARQ
jgi:DNA-binding HxlR family transcriptional regulator